MAKRKKPIIDLSKPTPKRKLHELGLNSQQAKREERRMSDREDRDFASRLAAGFRMLSQGGD